MRKQRSRLEIHTGGGAYIGGGVNTQGGHFAGRDQVTNTVSAQTGINLKDFLDLLANLRIMLQEAGLDSTIRDRLDADVRVIEEQIKQPKPNSAIVVSKLEGVTKVLDAAAATSVAAAKLLPAVRTAVEWAGQLFH